MRSTYAYRFSPAWRVTAGLQHRLQAAVVQRSLLSGLLEPGPRARDLAQRRGGALLERRIRARRGRGARDRLSQPGVPADRPAVRRGVQLRPVQRRSRDARRASRWPSTCAATTASRSRPRSISRRPRTTLPASCLPRRARRHGAVTRRCTVRAGAGGRRARRVVAALRRPGESRDDGRLRDREPDRSNGRSRRGVTLFARADNVLDKNYELAAGYATGGATVFGGIRLSLR